MPRPFTEQLGQQTHRSASLRKRTCSRAFASRRAQMDMVRERMTSLGRTVMDVVAANDRRRVKGALARMCFVRLLPASVCTVYVVFYSLARLSFVVALLVRFASTSLCSCAFLFPLAALPSTPMACLLKLNAFI